MYVTLNAQALASGDWLDLHKKKPPKRHDSVKVGQEWYKK